MDTTDTPEKKHTFFSVFLLVMYFIFFFMNFRIFMSESVAIGPFLLRGPQVLAYTSVTLIVLLAMIVGMIRRTNWIFWLSLTYLGFSAINGFLNSFVFSGTNEIALRDALEKAPENPLFSNEELYGLTKVFMAGTIVFSLVFTAMLIVFLFMARKNFEKNRIL